MIDAHSIMRLYCLSQVQPEDTCGFLEAFHQQSTTVTWDNRNEVGSTASAKRTLRES